MTNILNCADLRYRKMKLRLNKPPPIARMLFSTIFAVMIIA